MSDIITFDAAKRLFSHKQMVEELIRSFVQEEFVQEIDFSRLKRLSDVYITKQFRRRELDRIWEVKSLLPSAIPYQQLFLWIRVMWPN